jgi:hypothetical protein
MAVTIADATMADATGAMAQADVGDGHPLATFGFPVTKH